MSLCPTQEDESRWVFDGAVPELPTHKRSLTYDSKH